MDLTQQILSDIIISQKYARYIPSLKRRETWNEIVDRNKQMHFKKFPNLKEEIENAYTFVYDKKVLPSMRSLQFAGKPIEINNARLFNCSYLPIDDWCAFSEIMFLLLSGCGVGYSVQRHHVDKLPEIRIPTKTRRYLVADSIEGWADAIKMLCKGYFGLSTSLPIFDFRDIRAKGMNLITSGGKAPGSEPLRECLFQVQKIFDRKKNGEKLNSVEVHDIACHLADAVLSGGIRRAALIALFDFDDEEMLSSKYGNWWEQNPQRGRANNSAVILRHKIKKKEFFELWKKIELSNSGEPGFMFSNDKELGTNPCAEISLKSFCFCNLCEINSSNIESQDDLNERVRSAAFIGTLQASYTDFHYLRDIWKKTAEKEALLGLGMTGIASGEVLKYDLETAANKSLDENERVAKVIGINKAARVTTVKPSGTSSIVLGCSSGVHAWHDQYYIRRIRIGKTEALYTYLSINHPELVEDDYFKPSIQAVISIPVKAPDNAITRSETALELLDRVLQFNEEWIKNGHRKGVNYNNVSCTVNIDKEKYYKNPFNELADPLPCSKIEAMDSKFSMNEWQAVGDWMWKNKKDYAALSVLPSSDSNYVQSPFETIDEKTFNKMSKHLNGLDMTKVIEDVDNTDLRESLACAGNSCEL